MKKKFKKFYESKVFLQNGKAENMGDRGGALGLRAL
jgi:hypothetical protein